MIADSNLLIYAANPKYPRARPWLAAVCPAISVITKVEVLGYHRITSALFTVYQSLIQALCVHPIDDAVIDKAIELRQSIRMKIPDALIAATALVHDVPLATANEVDFTNIPGLHVINPLRP